MGEGDPEQIKLCFKHQDNEKAKDMEMDTRTRRTRCLKCSRKIGIPVDGPKALQGLCS